MKKTLASIILLTGLFAGVASAMPLDGSTGPFTDVGKDGEYYDALVYLKDKGVISGYPDGSFKPFQTINRAEFTKIVMGANGYDPAKDPSGFDIYSSGDLGFKDVQDKAWYIPYLREAKKMDVIGGYPDGTFKPGQEINFAEASKIIVVSTGGEFAGAGYVPEDWFHKYVNILEEKYAIPTTINTFDQKITRGEMAEIIYRLDSTNTGKPSMTYELLAAPKGYFEGSLSYPTEGIPSEMMVCADNIEMAETFCTYNRINSSNYMYGVGYKLPVKPGTYNVYAWYNGITGTYSKYVTCGMSANCTDHTSIPVDINADQTVKDIDPADWYHN